MQVRLGLQLEPNTKGPEKPLLLRYLITYLVWHIKMVSLGVYLTKGTRINLLDWNLHPCCQLLDVLTATVHRCFLSTVLCGSPRRMHWIPLPLSINSETANDFLKLASKASLTHMSQDGVTGVQHFWVGGVLRQGFSV